MGFDLLASGEWAAQQLHPGDGAHSQGFTLPDPAAQFVVFRRPPVQRPNQKACVKMNHSDLKGSQRPRRVALGLLLPRPSGDIDLALAQGSLQSVEGAEGRTLAGFPSYQSRLGRECKGLPHRCVFEFDVVCVVQQTVADGAGLVRIANDAVPVRDGDVG